MLNPTSEVNSVCQSKEITTIIIADDHPLVRQALRTLIEKQSDLNLLAEASDGEEAINLATQLSPDIVIMDITMPKINGIEATRQIKRDCPNTKILVLTIYDDSEHILEILQAGAAGYLIKSVFGEEVLTAIRSVMAGDNVLSPTVLQQVLKDTPRYPGEPAFLGTREKLNSRDLQILKMLARGLSNKDIAQNLNLSLQTVKGYTVSIFSKLGASSRTEAVMIGLRSGILILKDLE